MNKQQLFESVLNESIAALIPMLMGSLDSRKSYSYPKSQVEQPREKYEDRICSDCGKEYSARESRKEDVCSPCFIKARNQRAESKARQMVKSGKWTTEEAIDYLKKESRGHYRVTKQRIAKLSESDKYEDIAKIFRQAGLSPEGASIATNEIVRGASDAFSTPYEDAFDDDEYNKLYYCEDKHIELGEKEFQDTFLQGKMELSQRDEQLVEDLCQTDDVIDAIMQTKSFMDILKSDTKLAVADGEDEAEDNNYYNRVGPYRYHGVSERDFW